ncbi:DUF6286 domain-containing protein [Actinomadura rubrisoli]|uniref:Alkaline shock response membrane anchor protein AmaP n=1 Tax=Actinomadura rubrisoli TaxID=2530368 RepID=A0A4R4ZZG3_9ACTN|nr:DUF6286 domain-containing protein [Actinomadura rubrisoli]TDD64741.1 alkaline shock response membrane anchor protein AmaP [Actinomadura rubrisoli]
MAESLVRDLIHETQSRQRARRLAAREFRPRRAVPGLVAALLVTVAGGAAAIELLAAALGSGVHPVPGAARLVDALGRLPWKAPGVRASAGAMAAAGLALLPAALPGRVRGVPLDGSDPRLAGALGRASLRRALADAALGVPGIERVRVRGPGVFRGRLVVRADTHYRNPANLAELVHCAVDDRLDRIEPMHRPRIDVRLGWRKD